MELAKRCIKVNFSSFTYYKRHYSTYQKKLLPEEAMDMLLVLRSDIIMLYMVMSIMNGGKIERCHNQPNARSENDDRHQISLLMA